MRIKYFFVAVIMATTQAFGQNATIARQPQADIKPSNLSNNCPSGPAGFDCRVAAIPSNSNSIYSACKANVDKVEELYKQPAFQHYMRPEGNALLVVRREQFKMILNTEINYASRIPSDSPVFETAWQDLRNRWESRVEENPEVLAVDQDSVVAPDRCGLHMLLGLSCDDHPGVDIIGAKKSEAIEQHQGESRGHGYSWSFTHKLLKYELMKMISEANWGNDVDLEKAPSELKYLLQEEKKLPINTVYRDFPELAISNHLSHYLMQLARSTGLSNKLSQEIGNLQEQKKAQKQHLSFYEKSLLIEKAMEQTFSKQTIPKQTQQYVENMFYDTYSELLKSFEEHIQKAKNDPDWAFSQDYLLGTYMSLAQARNDKFSAGVMQTIVCHNVVAEAEHDSHKEIILAIGGLLALATGIGAMVVAGGYAVSLLAISFGLMNAISAVEIYSAHQTAEATKYNFLYQSAEFTKLDEDNRAYIETLPWAFLNVIMISPIFVLKKVAVAKKAAELANDARKVSRLKLYEKTISIAMFSANAGITGMNAKPGYDAFLRIMKNLKEKEDLLIAKMK